ncbi:MAG: DNA-3-methyladenine glycosylase I [Rhodospirillales bacterium]
MSYCRLAPTDPVHRAYHDEEYGFPVADDRILFERLSLEIFQAGLSWRLILTKRPHFARAFADFDIARVAAFDETDVGRLLADAAIIRNRRKIEAVIANARILRALGVETATPGLAGESGSGGDERVGLGAGPAGLDCHRVSSSFAGWLAAHHPRSEAAWLKLFRGTFRFMGPEVVREFLLSIGYLAGAHDDDCPVQARILGVAPPWSTATGEGPSG